MPAVPPHWDGWHPIVAHFPIALLLVAPVFVFLAMIFFGRGRWFSVAALVLLGLGVGGAYLAQTTGEAAHQLVEDGPDEMFRVLEKHEALGSKVFPVFGVLAGAYAAFFLLALVLRPLDHPVVLFFVNLVFLVLLLGAGLLVANAGHLGGRLVHEFGVHGRLAASAEKPAEKPAETPDEKAEPKPEDKPADKPAEKPEEKPADKPEEKPAEKTEEKPAEKAEKPAEKEKPAETPKDKPAEKPQEEPPEKDKPADAPEPKEKPAEKAEDAPAEKPAVNTDKTT